MFAEAQADARSNIDAAYYAKYDRYGATTVGRVTGPDAHVSDGRKRERARPARGRESGPEARGAGGGSSRPGGAPTGRAHGAHGRREGERERGAGGRRRRQSGTEETDCAQEQGPRYRNSGCQQGARSRSLREKSDRVCHPTAQRRHAID
ncbi:MAG: hypothetical protein ACLQK4_04205 [Acidimicrobiales bacterium]